METVEEPSSSSGGGAATSTAATTSMPPVSEASIPIDDDVDESEFADANSSERPLTTATSRRDLSRWQAILSSLWRQKCYIVTVLVLLVAATTLGLTAFDLNNPNPVYHSVPPPLLVSSWNVTWTGRFGADVAAAPAAQLLVPLEALHATKTFSNVVAVADNASLVDAWTLRAVLHLRDYRHQLNSSALSSLYGAANGTESIVVSLVMQDLANVKARTYSPVKAWLMLFTLVGMLAFLLKENAIAPDVVLILALCFLTLVGIVTVDETLAGFSNSGIATVGILFTIATAIGNSGVLDLMSRYVLRNPASVTSALFRLMVPVAVASAFINNTPIVALMIPVVISWGQKTGVASSKLLMPLSFASILGGTVTLIGTSTNLIVRALLFAKQPDVAMPIFEMSQVGLPLAFVGILYIALIGHRLLPSNASLVEQFKQDSRSYTAHVVVQQAGPVAGKSLGDAGLRHLRGLFVVEVWRDGDVVSAPSRDFVLHGGDVLTVAGDVAHVNLLWAVEGLAMHEASAVQKIDSSKRHLIEVVVSRGSDLIGYTARDVRFRNMFNAAIVGVHRHGEQIKMRVGDVKFEAGDTLLLVGDEDFLSVHRHAPQFSLVSAAGRADIPRKLRPALFVATILIAAAMIVVASIDALGVSLFISALVACLLYWMLGVLTVSEARHSVDLSVMVMVASSIGLSSAMENSGLSARMGASLIDLFAPVGDAGLLVGLYLAVCILTAFVSNSAAVSLVFPIAYELGVSSSLKIKAVMYVLCFAGSADFSTPIGYQTNLMVYSVGGYKFTDYVRVGMPLQALALIVCCSLCYVVFN